MAGIKTGEKMGTTTMEKQTDPNGGAMYLLEEMKRGAFHKAFERRKSLANVQLPR